MSIIYPNKINSIKYDGDTLTGNILSVGNDGQYPYDYDHPQDAVNAASSGDVILIYPGTYSPISGVVLNINKDINIYIRGMGESPEDVILTTPTDVWHTIRVNYTGATNLFVVVENLTSVANRSSSGAFVHRECSSTTVTILNKLYLNSPNGYTVYFGDTISHSDYKGDCYVTNCRIKRGSYHLREVGRGSSTSTISFEKIYYTGGVYTCLSCLRAPSPHDYVTSSTPGYGSDKGNFLLELITVPTYNILAGTSANYKAVWADPSASINNAKMYVATTGSGSAFSVVDLQYHVLVDSYSITNQGINEEYLEREDIVDINVRA
jgi:hypothetical protein